MRFNKIILLCLFWTHAILPAVHAAAPVYSWEFAGWYGGGCFPNLAFDPHNQGRVYLASDVAGIFRSDDHGEKWYFVTKGLGNLMVAQVAVAPSDPNVLYAATQGGVFLSRDAGGSWSAADKVNGAMTFERPANYRSIAIDPKDAGKLCVGTAKGAVYCSANSGASWREVVAAKQIFLARKPVTALAFDGQDRLYAASKEGMIRCSADRSACEGLNGPSEVTDFEFSQRSPKTVYAAGAKALWVSHNEGITWEQTALIPKGNTFRVALDESAERLVIRVIWNKDWDGGVLISKDAGVSWQSQDSALNAEMNLLPAHQWVKSGGRSTALKVDPFNPQAVFRADFFSLWRSDDGGATWKEKILGAPNTVAADLAFTTDGQILVASMDNGLLASSNNAQNYQMLFPLKYADDLSGHVWRVATASGTIIASSSPWNKKINQLIVSNDGGKTFDVIRNGLPEGRPKVNTLWGEGYARAIAVDPEDPNIVYLGIDGDDGGGLFISKDRARTWARSSGQPGALKIYKALKVDPTDPRRILWGACGSNGGIYISEDAGQTFRYAFNKMTWVFDLDVAPDGTIYAAGDSGGAKLYSSSDHGRSWKLSGEFGNDRALASVIVDPQDPKNIAVSTASWGNAAPCRIFFSRNAGKSWQDITGDLPDGAGASSMTFDPEGKYLYITRYAGSVYRLKL